MPTGIPYCDEVWNPIIGCTKIKSGCLHCWAERLHTMRHKALHLGKNVPRQYEFPFSFVNRLFERLDIPLHWRKPRTIFVNSMSDTFHEDVPYDFIMEILDVVQKCPQHTFLFFTKRWDQVWEFFGGSSGTGLQSPHLPNLHIYFSASTQAEVDEAVPILLQIPAAVRGLSLEPLLGPVNLCLKRSDRRIHLLEDTEEFPGFRHTGRYGNKIGSIIVGCESGSNRRPCKLEWIESLLKQTEEAGVACYVKQIDTTELVPLGVLNNKVSTKPEEWPPEFRIRSMPK